MTSPIFLSDWCPADMIGVMDSEIVVAFVTGGCAIVVACVTWMQNGRSNLSEAFRRLSEAQLNMQREIDRQDEKLAEFADDCERLRRLDTLKTSYIRAIGHWLGELCHVLDPGFLKEYPKPSLPDELRGIVAPLPDRNGEEHDAVQS